MKTEYRVTWLQRFPGGKASFFPMDKQTESLDEARDLAASLSIYSSFSDIVIEIREVKDWRQLVARAAA